jgi:hypothetical protein
MSAHKSVELLSVLTKMITSYLEVQMMSCFLIFTLKNRLD